VTYPFVQATFDYGPRRGPALAFVVHMAEGGGTVGYLSREPARGVSVHYVIEYTGRIVQMLLEGHASGSIDPSNIRTSDDPDGFYGVTAAEAVMGSCWSNPNAACISVEIEGFAASGPNAAQHGSLRTLVDDVRSRYPAIGLLGHRDFADYKACPGRLIHWTELGGHGPRENVMQKPITDEVEKMVTAAAGNWYDLDGTTVLAKARPALAARPSPYGVGSKRAIFAEFPLGGNERRVVLVIPSTVMPLPAPDCSAAVTTALEAAALRAADAVKRWP